ncbi:MAG: hypothetical protein ACK4ND_09290 [Cytophagaceae bacterium]
MSLTSLEKELTQLILKKNELAKLSYSDKKYDELEDEIHDMEDDFLEKHGEELDGILESVHDEVCPESDLLLPTAYLANKYVIKGKKSDGSPEFDVEGDEGVFVETEEHPGRDTRLVLIPNPLRVILTIDEKEKHIVWEAK